MVLLCNEIVGKEFLDRYGFFDDFVIFHEVLYFFPQGRVLEFEVVEAENAVAGDTATGATKEVITETGLKVKTPLFVNIGDRIKVNTETGEYITRV